MVGTLIVLALIRFNLFSKPLVFYRPMVIYWFRCNKKKKKKNSTPGYNGEFETKKIRNKKQLTKIIETFVLFPQIFVSQTDQTSVGWKREKSLDGHFMKQDKKKLQDVDCNDLFDFFEYHRHPKLIGIRTIRYPLYCSIRVT